MITLHQGDCLEVLPKLGQFDMIFADPPDNIGLGYNGFEDSFDDYQKFLGGILCVMADHAPISWMSFNAKWYIEVCTAIHEFGLNKELNCKFFVQTFSFGNNQKKDFTNGFRPILRMMRKDAVTYPKQVYVESWRLKNGDPRANPEGKMPDDVWEFPRVTGNARQRRKWSPTQLHEGLYKRAIDFSTKSGDRIVDMFAGSGTMARVAGETHDVHLIEYSKETADNIARDHENCIRP